MSTLVVSNTSPVLNLALIGHLDLLRQQFGAVTVPRAVLDELRLEDGLPGNEAINRAMADGWIKTVSVRSAGTVRVLSREIDLGESEAIALALELSAGLILLDERDARQVAKRLCIQTTGVLGILLRGYRDGQIPDIEGAIRDLRDVAGFFVAPPLEREILAQIRPGRSTRDDQK
ncbi:MAG: hypothetical protein A3K19_20650 [Lentisphaerae bacterium RIFOXYB12_FULL_65_16]|nr:MAG: hypothetical protein A3K18_22240 [Lentisphaerae bacterium RIFOXYA12_64_32]OGV89408.1 MAG: hypothetical protein A3K19_20650 [Lentisphaerae bacterium RIFOXYB12_FULL_65_16]